MSAPPLLELVGVTKRFGGGAALQEVDFELRPGEIHGLIGENGAGKSTLTKILSGVHTDYDGEMRLRGQPVRLSSPVQPILRSRRGRSGVILWDDPPILRAEDETPRAAR